MAITVQYSPDAQLVAQAAMTAGQGDYNRWAAQQALNERELAQRKELTQLQVADGQYQQKVGILDGQYRQTQQIGAAQTEQLRNIANQQQMAQYDAYNTNWRFGAGIANDQAMQSQRLAVGLQQQQNDILSSEYRQQQQLAQQNLSDVRNIQAQQQRTMAALQMERANTLSQLQARQQSEQFQAQQQMRMSMLDGQQRAGLMGLQSQLSAQAARAEQANAIERMNYSTQNQLDLSSTLADKAFRQKNFLGEYADQYELMSQREYEGSYKAVMAEQKAAEEWAVRNGLSNDPNVMQQIRWNFANKLMGVKARTPIYTDAEMSFKNGLVTYGGEKYMMTDRGFEPLPNPNARIEEVRLRGVNEVMAKAMESGTRYADAIFNAKMEEINAMTVTPEVRASLTQQAADIYDKALKSHVEDRLRAHSAIMGTDIRDFAQGF